MIVSDALLWILPPLLIALAVGAAGHALLTKLDSSAAFGWIALCIILPLAGPILYLLFGLNRVSKRARKTYLTKLLKDSSDTLNEPPGTDFRPLSMVGERIIKKGLSSCDEIVILENGEALYPAMLEAINTATRRILLSTYIFDNDETGRQFVQALAAARERGVEVKVIVDGMGEFTSLPRIGGLLRRHQIDFVRFNPITLIPPALDLNMRSHRKVLVVDGVFAFTGGANIGIRHLSERLGHWNRAMDIHFRMRGRIVDELEWAFRRDWHYCQGTRHLGPFQHCNRIHIDAPAWSRLILDGPNKDLDRINDLILGVVSAAQHKVWIMTPYFLPTLDLIGALHAAYLRGVDVQILLPGYNNIKPAHWACRNFLRQVLKYDVNVFYQPPPFVHSKLLLIDDQYALIGSSNLDPRSLRLNYELGVELFSSDLNAQLSGYFSARREQARRVTREEIERRSVPERLRDSLAWLFSPYL